MTLIGLAFLAGSVHAQHVVREVTIPAAGVRSLLPGDGELISKTLTPNKWPQNPPGFERDEMIEVALGRAIRARPKDRGHEASLSPGVAFHDGYLSVQGGWRMHKQVDSHPDYFDGVFNAAVAVAVVGGKSHVEADVDLNWRVSKVALLIPLTPLVYPVVKQQLESEVERRIRESVARLIDTEISKMTSELHLPPQAMDRIVADITPAGMRIRLFDRAVAVAQARFSGVVDFKPPRISGDDEFGGNGPQASIVSAMTVEGQQIVLRVTMDAQETAHRNDKKKWTRAAGTAQIAAPVAGGTVIGLLGRREWVLFSEKMDGHEPVRLVSPLGRLEVRGDRRGKDVGAYTGFVLTPSFTAMVLVAP